MLERLRHSQMRATERGKCLGRDGIFQPFGGHIWNKPKILNALTSDSVSLWFLQWPELRPCLQTAVQDSFMNNCNFFWGGGERRGETWLFTAFFPVFFSLVTSFSSRERKTKFWQLLYWYLKKIKKQRVRGFEVEEIKWVLLHLLFPYSEKEHSALSSFPVPRSPLFVEDRHVSRINIRYVQRQI